MRSGSSPRIGRRRASSPRRWAPRRPPRTRDSPRPGPRSQRGRRRGRRAAAMARAAATATATSEYTIHGPDEDATAEESEEALAGFSAAWALFRHVLPAARDRRCDAVEPWRRRPRGARPARGRAPERRRPPVLDRSGPARPERARRRGDLAVAGRADLRVRLAADVRDGQGRLRAARAMTAAIERPSAAPTLATVARRRCVGSRRSRCWRGSAAVVAARWCATRAGLDPLRGRRRVRARPGRPRRRRRAGGARRSLAAFAATVALAAPVAVGDRSSGSPSSRITVVGPRARRSPRVPGLGRPAAPFLPWAAITILVASAEEAAPPRPAVRRHSARRRPARGGRPHDRRLRADARAALRLARRAARPRRRPRLGRASGSRRAASPPRRRRMPSRTSRRGGSRRPDLAVRRPAAAVGAPRRPVPRRVRRSSPARTA